jgi:hypothetical protein
MVRLEGKEIEMTERLTNRVQVTMDSAESGGDVIIWGEHATLVFENGVWGMMQGHGYLASASESEKRMIEILAGRELSAGDRWVVEVTTI